MDGEEISFTETTAFASALDSSYSEWLLGSGRKAGDITTAETSSGCYVVVFDSRDDNSGDTVNVRHILIEAEADEEGNYTDEAKAAAKERAEEILQEWERRGRHRGELCRPGGGVLRGHRLQHQRRAL